MRKSYISLIATLLLVGCVEPAKDTRASALAESECYAACDAKGVTEAECDRYCADDGKCNEMKFDYCVSEMKLSEAVCKKKAAAWCADDAN